MTSKYSVIQILKPVPQVLTSDIDEGTKTPYTLSETIKSDSLTNELKRQQFVFYDQRKDVPSR